MIIVTGSGNILAASLCGYLQQREDVYSLSGIPADISPEVSIIVNCHQYDDIDRAEYFREDAYRENADTAGRLAEMCYTKGIPLVQVGTSLVFSGQTDRPWREDDEPRPVNVFGDSKLLGEQYIRESGCEYIIIRLPELYNERSSPFHSAIRCSREGRNAVVLKERWMAPLPAGYAASAIVRLVETRFRGVIHYSAADAVDHAHFIRYGLDLAARRFPGLDARLDEIGLSEYGRPADLSSWEVLDTSLYRSITGDVPPSWHQALEKYMLEDFVPPDMG